MAATYTPSVALKNLVDVLIGTPGASAEKLMNILVATSDQIRDQYGFLNDEMRDRAIIATFTPHVQILQQNAQAACAHFMEIGGGRAFDAKAYLVEIKQAVAACNGILRNVAPKHLVKKEA